MSELTKAEVLNKKFEHSRVVYIDDLMRLGRTSKKNSSKASIKTKALTIAECKVSSVMSRVVRIIINAIRSTDTAIFRLVANTYSTRRNTQHAIMLKSRKIEKQITGYLSEL